MFSRTQMRSLLAVAALGAFGLMAPTACAPAPKIDPNFVPANTTGGKTADGRAMTGAAPDRALEDLKLELSTVPLSNTDRDLAGRVLGANLESQGEDALRVVLQMRDESSLTFQFKKADLQSADEKLGERRYRSIKSREQAQFEMALFCSTGQSANKAACPIATLSLKDTRGTGARAGIILRKQDTTVLARSNQKELTDENLNRLLKQFATAQPRQLQSFEVAWGTSGFTLDLQDSAVCPMGRLVETNDSDEKLQLSCVGQNSSLIEGRLIGNTTRGELFLELSAAAVSGESKETVFLLVQRKPRSAKPPEIIGTPGEESYDDSNSVFTDDSNQSASGPSGPSSPVANPIPLEGKSGWLIPIDPKNPITISWNRDRKNPAIDSALKTWLKQNDLKRFARGFLPNRNLVVGKLLEQKVPAEIALLTLIESRFFKDDGYPVQVSSANAVGPWQFIASTAALPKLGLQVFPIIGKGASRQANPCDERADLAKSSEAAGKLMRTLLDTFPRDPKLALMAYNWGERGVKRNLECLKSSDCMQSREEGNLTDSRLKEIKDAGLNYWAIRRFNMAPAETLQYVVSFVSAFHASLEMDPIAVDPSVSAWAPNKQCATK